MMLRELKEKILCIKKKKKKVEEAPNFEAEALISG